MNKTILLVLLFIFQIGYSKAELSEVQKLTATCKVWGFLKYYHPKVANGDFNWDNQLFEVLPKIEQAKTKEEFSLVLENWINSLGEVKEMAPMIQPKEIEYFDKNFDLSWIDKNKLFSKKLSQKLKFIENNRFQGEQHYVEFEKTSFGLEIINEEKYSENKWEDKKLRILTLFRYWNYVEYFFPYKYQMDQNWNISLLKILPKFINPSSKLEYHLAMRELVISLNDTHAWIGTSTMYEKFGNKFIPATVKILENKVLITALQDDSLSLANDLKVGDVITKIEGKTIKEIIKEKRKYAEGSNDAALLKNFYWHIFNGNTDSVKIEFSRNGTTKVKNIGRYLYKNIKIKYDTIQKPTFKFLDNNIGYVDLALLSINDIPKIMGEFKNTKSIIFDIRNYPNDVEYAIAEYLNPDVESFSKNIIPDLSYPSRYIWQEDNKCGKKNSDYYKGKIVILVNEETVSHAEWTAMCLETAPDATVIGSQTAGADGNVCKFELIKGFKTQITGLGVFYPDKSETQRIGIIPDIEVKPTIKGIQQGKDEVLERAIQFIETGK